MILLRIYLGLSKVSHCLSNSVVLDVFYLDYSFTINALNGVLLLLYHLLITCPVQPL